MAERSKRELRFERKMSDAEALMWNIEKDPWLNPSGGVVTILDRPIDRDSFRARIRQSVAEIPRLRERVVSTTGRLTNPTWTPDVEFEFDWHVRHVSLPAPGTERQLFDLTALLLADPYDRTRPLWQFFIIDGLSEGRGALFWRFHHSIMDGRAAIRLTESYMDLTRSVPRAAPVDLDALIANASSETADDYAAHSTAGGGPAEFVVDALRGPIGVARRVASELLMMGADPLRGPEAGASAAHSITTLRDMLGSPESSGSTLWKHRSRRRHIEALSMPLAQAKAAAKILGGSINDLFVAGAVAGAVSYHERYGERPEYLNVSFVVSTRDDSAIGGNSFTPSIVKIPTTPGSLAEQVQATGALMGEQRADVGGGGGLMSSVATIAKLLPTSVVTSFGRQQAAAVDFATSNMRGAPFDVYIAGAKLVRNVTLGPVAGTAFNMTCLSMGDHLDIGMHIDPFAVAEPGVLRECMERAYEDLLAAGSSSLAPRTAPAEPKKSAKKPSVKKSVKKVTKKATKRGTTKPPAKARAATKTSKRAL